MGMQQGVQRSQRERDIHHPSVPFAVETGGRLGTDARAFLIRCAEASDEPVMELQRLYRAISSVLQDGVARQLEASG